MDLTQLVRPNILKMKAYSSARDEFEGEGEVFLDANENPFETGNNRYPDPYQRTVKNKIAELKGIEKEHIFLGNGSDEAIDLIVRIFCEPGKDKVLTTDPTYGMYEVSASIQNVAVVKVPLTKKFELSAKKVLAAVDEHTKVIFVCTPHNPSGADLSNNALVEIIKNFNGIVVIDEAYIDFTDVPSFINDLASYPNLIVLQTLSKAWGMAGLRVGMAFASTEIIRYFNKVKPPYNIGIATQREVLSQLEDKPVIEAMIREIKRGKEQLVKYLSTLDFVTRIYPSSANFLLVKFSNAKEVFDYLTGLKIVVRDRSKVLHCENCLRITVGTEEENERLIVALSAFKLVTHLSNYSKG